MLVGIYWNQNEITVESFNYGGTNFRLLWMFLFCFVFAYLINFVNGKAQRFSVRTK